MLLLPMTSFLGYSHSLFFSANSLNSFLRFHRLISRIHATILFVQILEFNFSTIWTENGSFSPRIIGLHQDGLFFLVLELCVLCSIVVCWFIWFSWFLFCFLSQAFLIEISSIFWVWLICPSSLCEMTLLSLKCYVGSEIPTILRSISFWIFSISFFTCPFWWILIVLLLSQTFNCSQGRAYLFSNV